MRWGPGQCLVCLSVSNMTSGGEFNQCNARCANQTDMERVFRRDSRAPACMPCWLQQQKSSKRLQHNCTHTPAAGNWCLVACEQPRLATTKQYLSQVWGPITD